MIIIITLFIITIIIDRKLRPPNRRQTVPELVLRGAELLVRRRQMGQFVVELFLQLGELRVGEGVEVDGLLLLLLLLLLL